MSGEGLLEEFYLTRAEALLVAAKTAMAGVLAAGKAIQLFDDRPGIAMQMRRLTALVDELTEHLRILKALPDDAVKADTTEVTAMLDAHHEARRCKRDR